MYILRHLGYEIFTGQMGRLKILLIIIICKEALLFASFNHIKFLDSEIHVYFRPIGQIARGIRRDKRCECFVTTNVLSRH